MLAGHRQSAIASLTRAREPLAKLGDAPVKPRLDQITDVEAWVSRSDEYDVALRAHQSSVAEVSVRCYRELQALQRLANDAKREARALGIDPPDGVGLIPEHARRHGLHRQPLADLARSLDSGDEWIVLTVDYADSLIAALSEPEPVDGVIPSTLYPAGMVRPEAHDGGWISRGWQRISHALQGEQS